MPTHLLDILLIERMYSSQFTKNLFHITFHITTESYRIFLFNWQMTNDYTCNMHVADIFIYVNRQNRSRTHFRTLLFHQQCKHLFV